MIRCNICLSKKTARFKTSDFSICQSCVKLLSINAKSFQVVHEHVLALAQKNAPKPPVKPVFDATTEQCRNEASNILFKDESLMGYFLSSIFNASSRKRAIDDYAHKLFSKKQTEFKNELESYNIKQAEYLINLESAIQNIYDDILNGKFNRQEADTVFRRGYRWRTVQIYRDVLTSLDKDIVKILRGFKYKIITEGEKCRRLTVSDTSKVKINIYKRDDYKCVICGTTEGELHLHHIVALNNYGTNHYNNLATLCYTCHNKRIQSQGIYG